MRLPTSKLAKLEGLISPEVGRRLAELAFEVDPAVAIVEVGSYKGKSTCYLAAGAQAGAGAHVFAHDAWDLPGNIGGRFGYDQPARRAEFEAQVASMGLNDHITAAQCFSTDAAAAWSRPIGLLFIDANHTYEDLRADLMAWLPHVVPGGVVALDDYGTPKNPGIKELVDELHQRSPEIEWDFATPPLAIFRVPPLGEREPPRPRGQGSE